MCVCVYSLHYSATIRSKRFNAKRMVACNVTVSLSAKWHVLILYRLFPIRFYVSNELRNCDANSLCSIVITATLSEIIIIDLLYLEAHTRAINRTHLRNTCVRLTGSAHISLIAALYFQPGEFRQPVMLLLLIVNL